MLTNRQEICSICGQPATKQPKESKAFCNRCLDVVALEFDRILD